MVQKKESVVHGVVTKLRTNIANMNILQRFMSFQIPYLNHKRVGSIAFSINDKLSHYHSMICGTSKGTNPPL